MDTLAMIDAEETRLLTQLAEVRAAKAVLKRVCGLADPPHGPTVVLPEPPPPSVPAEAPPGKPEPRQPASGPGKKRGPAPDAGRPLRIARFLLDHGPKRVGEMEAAGVAPQPRINAELKTHATWFQKTGPSLRAPWELTEAGREAVTVAASSAS